MLTQFWATWLSLVTFTFACISVADEPSQDHGLTREILPRWENSEHGCVLSMDLSPDGQLLATAGTLPGNARSIGDAVVAMLQGPVKTGGVQLRQLKNGQLNLQVNNLLKTSYQVVFSPDGKKLAIASGSWTDPGQIVLVDAESGRIMTRLKGHSGWVFSVAFSPDGNQVVSGGSKSPRYHKIPGGEAWLWDVTTGEGRQIWKSDSTLVTATAYAADGRHFATVGADDGQLSVWDAETGERKFELKGHPLTPGTIAFSPDAKTLVSCNTGWGHVAPHRYDAKLILWDVATGQSRQTVNVTKWWAERRTIRFGELAFSPDGKYLALPMGSWNRGAKWAQLSLVNIQKLADPKTVFAAENQPPATSAVFSENGDILVAAFGHGEIKRWRMQK